MTKTKTYSGYDLYLVRTGETVVEFAPILDGDIGEYTFSRFRSYTRAQKFAETKRAEGYSVKAWRCLGSDQSEHVSL
jgi:hypothetical protein